MDCAPEFQVQLIQRPQTAIAELVHFDAGNGDNIPKRYHGGVRGRGVQRLHRCISNLNQLCQSQND